jgi:hypothetical protein
VSGEKKKKRFWVFTFFLGVRDGQIHRGDEFVLGYQKKNGTIHSCAVCIIGEWIETFPMDFDTAEGRPGYSQTSPSPIISNLNGRPIALCRSSSACSIVISA